MQKMLIQRFIYVSLDLNCMIMLRLTQYDTTLSETYTKKEKFILSLKYDKIKEVEDDIWACYKDGMLMFVKTEPGD